MRAYILLKKSPKIEFHFQENGFKMNDGQTEQNTGFYAYRDIRSIDLDNAWFPSLSKYLRMLTWVLNGVPFFPDAESCKKAKLIFNFDKKKKGIWLTDTYMAGKAKKIKSLIDEKIEN
jgi:hypothetical protein